MSPVVTYSNINGENKVLNHESMETIQKRIITKQKYQ